MHGWKLGCMRCVRGVLAGCCRLPSILHPVCGLSGLPGGMGQDVRRWLQVTSAARVGSWASLIRSAVLAITLRQLLDAVEHELLAAVAKVVHLGTGELGAGVAHACSPCVRVSRKHMKHKRSTQLATLLATHRMHGSIPQLCRAGQGSQAAAAAPLTCSADIHIAALTAGALSHVPCGVWCIVPLCCCGDDQACVDQNACHFRGFTQQGTLCFSSSLRPDRMFD